MSRYEEAGILLIDKPAGKSSAGVIAEVKRKLRIKKIGHAGTLDPMATGLLVCLLNGATRMAHYAEAGEKIYTGEILFGRVTDSDDVTGETLSEKDIDLESSETREALLGFVPEFTGEIEQTPPRVSAVKVDGKRAYALARSGVDVKLKSRKVTVSAFDLEIIDKTRASFSITCSKGTYIRSIARDLGERLGCGACLGTLRRAGSYPFSVADATLLEDADLESAIRWEKLFPDIPTVALPEKSVAAILSGNTTPLREIDQYLTDTNTASMLLYGGADKPPVGLLVHKDNSWKIGVNLPCQV